MRKEWTFHNENSYTVFVPFNKDKTIDFESELFGAYTDEEWDRIRPFDKYNGDYTTSWPLKSLEDAKLFKADLEANNA
jgi:hypothetical protein